MTDQPQRYCCDRMKFDLAGTCEQHSRHDCPNFFFTYNEVFDEYGLMHDDGTKILVGYCPFCGIKFPDSKRDLWFDRLEALGYEKLLFNDDIPQAYKSAAWRRDLPPDPKKDP
ncbi:MAG: hypothetical protein AAF626_13205 [Pseudomonadota bacterium]